MASPQRLTANSLLAANIRSCLPWQPVIIMSCAILENMCRCHHHRLPGQLALPTEHHHSSSIITTIQQATIDNGEKIGQILVLYFVMCVKWHKIFIYLESVECYFFAILLQNLIIFVYFSKVKFRPGLN
jgi:hypothetical protein